jgi:colanic acid biosynthesis glycosyl transferase WcaI
MKILVHGINYAPELTGVGKYTGEMVEWLAARGHEVRVVTAPPYYPQWRINDAYANGWSVWRRQGGGPTVYRCPLWVPAQPTGMKRLLHLASFALASFPVMAAQAWWRPDVVWVVEPPLFCAPQAWLVARLCHARAWLHIQDFEVDAAFDLGILRAGWMKEWVLSLERFWLCRFDRVSTLSAKMLDKLRTKGIARDRGVLFPNWVDPAEIHPLAESSLRRQPGFSAEQFVALYSGNMGEKQGLEIVLEAARQLRDDPAIRFVLCGAGAAKQRLQKSYADLQNITWLPLQPAAKLNDLLNLADVHLLPQRADAADLVMPSKLLGMLASGRPVLTTATGGSQVGELVALCGVVCADDAGAVADALHKLAGDAGWRRRLGMAGRAIAEAQFSKEAVLHKFESELMGAGRV